MMVNISKIKSYVKPIAIGIIPGSLYGAVGGLSVITETDIPKIKQDNESLEDFNKRRNELTKKLRDEKLRNVVLGALIGGSVGGYTGYKFKRIIDETNKFGDDFYKAFTGNYSNKNPEEIKKYFGKQFENITTKAEAKKIFRSKALTVHPDKPGGSHEKMQELNDMWNQFKNSYEYEKLAFLYGYNSKINELEKVSSFRYSQQFGYDSRSRKEKTKEKSDILSKHAISKAVKKLMKLRRMI